jgi:hypothetical protein
MIYINLIYLLVAVVTVFGSLRILDLMTGEKFKRDQLPILKSEPLALAVYRAGWVVGVCFLAGSMLGV